MEEESERLKEEERCDAVDMQLLTSSPQSGPFYNMTPEERIDADNRSIYVGNVDYGATADELEIHFNGCGPVNRVTILCDRFSGHPKGFAYIEFSDRDSGQSAISVVTAYAGLWCGFEPRGRVHHFCFMMRFCPVVAAISAVKGVHGVWCGCASE
uniref:RRM domain-containing protein n=1 Tax=Oreochromis aureus TaxID=47969 RepID=A0AAZ1X117_OREAU